MIVELSLEDIDDFAKRFWDFVKNFRIFLFYGPMGAGKTTIISALCKAKGVTDSISSPTYSIINQYHYLHNNSEETIYHIDLYRLKDEEEIIQAGVEDCLYSGALCMVEWPQKAPGLFDSTAVIIDIVPVNATTRQVKITLPAAIMKEQS